MENRLSVTLNGEKCYDILFETSFESLPDELLKMYDSSRKLCIITDSNVSALYADEVSRILSAGFDNVSVFEFPAGEESKNLMTVTAVYRFLLENNFNRRDVIIAL